MLNIGNNIILKHSNSGMLKEARLGFSWVTLLTLGIFPLFKGDFKWFFIQSILFWITGGLSSLIFPFFYNKIYVKSLLEKGYIPADEETREILEKKGIITNKEVGVE